MNTIAQLGRIAAQQVLKEARATPMGMAGLGTRGRRPKGLAAPVPGHSGWLRRPRDSKIGNIDTPEQAEMASQHGQPAGNAPGELAHPYSGGFFPGATGWKASAPSPAKTLPANPAATGKMGVPGQQPFNPS